MRAQVNGVELAWEELGDPRGEPLVLIMGLGMQMVGWDEALCAQLGARGFRVIRFDNRDVGRSTWFDAAGDPQPLAVLEDLRRKRPVTPAYTLADMADDVAALLDTLRIRAAHVAGASMGGMIAQELAIRHPERVLSLTSIMSTTGNANVRGASYEVLGALLAPFPPDRAGFLARSVSLARTIGSTGFPFDERYVRQLAARAFDRGYHPAGVRRQLIAIWAGGDRTAALGQLKLPALVFHGEADPLIPVDGGRATAQAIPGAKLVVVPGMGHDLPRAVWPRLVDEIASLAHGRKPE